MRTARPERANVRTVAAAAGVSPATVSRVLNGAHNVTPETADRVRTAITELGLEPPAPRVLRETRRGSIFVRCPDILTDYFGIIVSAVVETLQQAGWSVVIDSGETAHERHPLSKIAATPGIAGAVVVLAPETDAELGALQRRKFPFVVIDPRTPPPPDVAAVSASHYAGANRLANHLIELGHRRIGAIVGPHEWLASTDRLSGIVAALAGVGQLQPPELVRWLTPTFEHGMTAGGELLDETDPPTAIMCFNDKVAVGALRAAALRGLRVPDDLSITGFDDLDVSHVTQPQLTTMRQPLEEMGRMAVTLLQRLLDGQEVTSLHVELATRLLVRDSTAPVRADRAVES